jgi:hypothetical protein
MICTRCGRAQPPEAEGPFCAHCGQFLVATRWVASAPADGPAAGQGESGATGGYTGPPSYRSTPNWGYPAEPWRPNAPSESGDTTEHADPVSPGRRLQLQAGLLIPLLHGLAVLAVLSAVGEIWRYILLLESRDDALSASAVAASDALVAAASWVATAASVGVGIYLMVWVLRIVRVSADNAGVRPSRSRWTLLVGWLVPGINLTVPGSVLTEIEHTALGLPATQRPKPSTLLMVWWGLWAANVVLGVVTLLWSLRSGVQAQADGVELHVMVDLVVAATAETTARVVAWLTALVNPPPVRARPLVVRVKDDATRSVSTVTQR